jgi:drug/metabolite transporter (DMT)-like permease
LAPISKTHAAVAALAGAAVIWATPAVFMSWLGDYFDPFTMNVYRYGVAALALVAYTFFRRPRPAFPDARELGALGLVLVPSILYQTAWAYALARHLIYPATGSLVIQLSVIVSIAAGYVLFRDERRVILTPRFFAGTVIALVGVAVVILAAPPGSDTPTTALGAGLAVLAAVGWGFYAVTIKRAVRRADSQVAFTVVCVYMTLALLAIAVGVALFGPADSCDLAAALNAPWKANVGIVASGVACIAVAHVLYYVGIRAIGVAVGAMSILTIPAITAVVSFVFLGERLGGWQIAFGALVLAGTYLALGAGLKARVTSAPPEREDLAAPD